MQWKSETFCTKLAVNGQLEYGPLHRYRRPVHYIIILSLFSQLEAQAQHRTGSSGSTTSGKFSFCLVTALTYNALTNQN